MQNSLAERVEHRRLRDQSKGSCLLQLVPIVVVRMHRDRRWTNSLCSNGSRATVPVKLLLECSDFALELSDLLGKLLVTRVSIAALVLKSRAGRTGRSNAIASELASSADNACRPSSECFHSLRGTRFVRLMIAQCAAKGIRAHDRLWCSSRLLFQTVRSCD